MQKKPLILGHRGFSGIYPENTMLAFIKAYEAGADGVELDIQLTKDGELVIVHDSTVDRTTNGSGKISEFSLKAIQFLDAAHTFTDYGKQQIPTLNEYFEWVQDKSFVTNIELKTDENEYAGIEQKLVQLIKQYDRAEKIIVSSFNYQTIERIKFLAPDLKCGLLTIDFQTVEQAKGVIPDLLIEQPTLVPSRLIDYAENLGADYLHPNYLSLTSEITKQITDRGLGINIWTVDHETDMHQLLTENVNSIITNYPDRLKRIMNKEKINQVQL